MRWTTPLKPALSVGESLLDRILCVAGAVAFSQFPEFIQQYLQRLGGHLDEARRQVAKFTETAAQSNLSLPQFIDRTAANGDTAVAKLGGVMQEAVDRVNELSFANAAIHDASLWERPFVFLRHVDPEIASATWSIYQPAVPTTVEGLIYALMGVVVTLCLYYGGIKYPALAFMRTRRVGRSKVSDIKPVPPAA
ncbi:MAG: DUF2937 family protein [Verrucomicrobiota bacterium]